MPKKKATTKHLCSANGPFLHLDTLVSNRTPQYTNFTPIYLSAANKFQSQKNQKNPHQWSIKYQNKNKISKSSFKNKNMCKQYIFAQPSSSEGGVRGNKKNPNLARLNIAFLFLFFSLSHPFFFFFLFRI